MKVKTLLPAYTSQLVALSDLCSKNLMRRASARMDVLLWDGLLPSLPYKWSLPLNDGVWVLMAWRP